MKKRIFVYGWYGHSNTGDELFKQAFQVLFPEIDFTFGDYIPKEFNYDALWFGSGTFLEASLNNPHNHQLDLPIGFIGIGTYIGAGGQPVISRDFLPLLKRAKLIISRDRATHQALPLVVDNAVLLADDLVFNLACSQPDAEKTIITVFLNEYLGFRGSGVSSLHWPFLGYTGFNLELADFLDELLLHRRVDRVVFAPMCTNPVEDDRRAAATVVTYMKHRDRVNWVLTPPTLLDILGWINQSQFIFTARYHGMVLSTMCGVPFIGLDFNGKLTSFMDDLGWGARLPYPKFDQMLLDRAVSECEHTNRHYLLNHTANAKNRWQALRRIIAERFSL